MALRRNVAGFGSSARPTGQPEYSGRLGKVDANDIDAWLEPYIEGGGGYSGVPGQDGDGPIIKYGIPVVKEVPEDGSVLNSGAPGGPYMPAPDPGNAGGDPGSAPTKELPVGTTENVLPVPADAGDKPANWWPWLLLAGGAYLVYKNGKIGSVGKAKKNKWVTPVLIAGGVGLLYLYSKKNGSTTAIDNGGGTEHPGNGGTVTLDPAAGAPASMFVSEELYNAVMAHAPMYAYSNLDFVSKALIGYATNLDQLGSGELTALYNYLTGYIIGNKPLTRAENEALYIQIAQIKNRYNIPLYV